MDPSCLATATWHHAAQYCNALSLAEDLTPCYVCGPAAESSESTDLLCETVSEFQNGGIYNCPGFRLPTEAEWETAYRAGTRTALYHGDVGGVANQDCELPSTPGADAIAWYQPNAQDRAHRVGQKGRNGWGLFDMAGNLAEWCHDGYLADRSGLPSLDPVVPTVGNGQRTVRGGSWASELGELRGAARKFFPPRVSSLFNGFSSTPALFPAGRASG